MASHNNAKYCRDCAKEVNEALAKVFSRISVRFEKVWVGIKNISIETLLEHERKLDEAEEGNGRVFCRKVEAPILDMNDLDNSMETFYVSYQHIDYRIERWTKTPERDKVEIAIRTLRRAN